MKHWIMLFKYDRFTRQFKIRRELECFFVFFLFLFCLFVCFFFGEERITKKTVFIIFQNARKCNIISLDDTKYKKYMELSFFENFTIEN